MKTMILNVIAGLLLSSMAFAFPPPHIKGSKPASDMKISCFFDDSLSARRLVLMEALHPSWKNGGDGDFNGGGFTDIKHFEVVIKGGKVIDGSVAGADNFADEGQQWDLKQTIAGKDDNYLSDPEVKNGKLSFGMGVDSWDHYNYTVKVDLKSKTAIIDEALELDCAGSGAATAAYKCYISEDQQK